MTHRSGPLVAEISAGDGEPRPGAPGRAPDRRQQRRWVPLMVGTLSMLIGLLYIVQGVLPGIYHHYHGLHRLVVAAPVTLDSLTRVADILTGLALLMLSHGLRRRK